MQFGEQVPKFWKNLLPQSWQ